MASPAIADVDKSSQSRSCILHIQTEEKQPNKDVILPFKPSNWESIKEAAARRKAKRNFHASKYYDIVQTLPDELDICQHGYHSQCYKNFTAIPMDDTKQSQDNISEKKHLRSDSPAVFFPPSFSINFWHFPQNMYLLQ